MSETLSLIVPRDAESEYVFPEIRRVSDAVILGHAYREEVVKHGYSTNISHIFNVLPYRFCLSIWRG